MVIRIHDVKKWARLEEGQVIGFTSDKPRQVRIEVNSPGDSELYYVDSAGEVTFLALVRGRQTVEFTTDGAFSLSVQGNDCMVYTPDGDDIAHYALDSESFTRIVERRARNPEFERMQWEMMANINRRLDRQKHELEQSYRRREAARERVPAAEALPGGADDESAQAGDDESSDTPAS